MNEKELLKKDRKSLLKIAKLLNITFIDDKSISKEEIIKSILAFKANTTSTNENLNKHFQEILDQATKENETLDSLSDAERAIYLEEAGKALGAPIPTQLPATMNNSDILTNLPVRVFEQTLSSAKSKYKLLDFQNVEMKQNGIFQHFYKDFTDAENKSGFSDVEIADFNKGINPTFTETFQVDTEFSKGYDLLENMLNDVTFSTGLYIALIKDYQNNITRAISKEMYKRAIKFFDTTSNYDGTEAFTSDNINEQAKQIFRKLTKLKTTSRKHLTVKPVGATNAFEYTSNGRDLVLLTNIRYAEEYKYDLAAGTYQMGEIKLPISEIVTIDFDAFEEYNKGATKILKDTEAILIDKGVYKEFLHYTGTKIVNTPKLKSVLNTYTRIGQARIKDGILYRFTKHTTTP